MKKLFCILFLSFIILSFSKSSQSFILGYESVGSDAISGGECTGYLVCQNFEGTGYDNGETWTEQPFGTGTIDEDYTTTVLRESQSLQVYQSSDSGSPYDESPGGFDLSTVYGFFKFRPSGGLQNTQVLRVMDNATNTIAQIRVNAVGTWRIDQGIINAQGGTVAADNTYFVWWKYVAATSGDGIFDLYVNDNTTKPGAATLSITTGDSTANVYSIRLTSAYSAAGYFHIFDQVYVDDADISDVPN